MGRYQQKNTPLERMSAPYAFARNVANDLTEEWIDEFEKRVELHPDLTVKGHLVGGAINPYHPEFKDSGSFYAKSLGGIPEPVLCVVRVSPCSAFVCFYTDDFKLEALSEELPISEACLLVRQLESDLHSDL